MFIKNIFCYICDIIIKTNNNMNLLNRLHPVYKDKLSKANLEYPHLIEKLTDELEQTQFVTELKYGSILDLHTFCGWLSSPFDYFTE